LRPQRHQHGEQHQQQEHHAQLGWQQQQQQQAAAAPACDRRAAPPALLLGDGTSATTRMMVDVAAACSTPGAGVGVALLAIALCSTHAGGADAAVAAHAPAGASSSLMDLAEGEEFWGNVAKYGRYFVTVMLGTGYVMVQPLLAAFKRPVTAAAALGALVGGFLLLRLVLNAMLGLQDLPLEPYP
jgi:hypothetical protein